MDEARPRDLIDAPADPPTVVRGAVGQDAARRGFSLDPGQEPAVLALDALAGRLDAPAPDALSGLYLWGPVGRGKTWLMDVFLATVAGSGGSGCVRVHFHDFLRRLHGERFHRGSIDAALDAILGEARLVCFDEFHVHDAGDAMLVARAVRVLDERGVRVVLTSNYPPSGLMPSPAYHHLFVPTIDLLTARLDVVEIGGDRDHRRSPSEDLRGFRGGAFVWPATDARLAAAGLARPEPAEATTVRVGSREHPVLALRDAIVWLGFEHWCAGRTAVSDVLHLADRYGSVVLDGVPALSARAPDTGQRFANLVDVLCDRDVPLHVLAHQDPDETLRRHGEEGVALDVERTASRLALLRRLGPVPVGR
ncbi:cell division protein ZapE [Oerskovia paurometabola]|uniref:Cell division protein ZapE n=1 Tax=Oerskovia paurometabola TaxID=162170 RepID=A0ABW1XB28_9CELL|nr:cell division protein ZapE [Oerskovia paurometabola]MBM7499127.1 cell division protein ZapE [Oerskovia paurometabola]